jgi:hypothetical protein
MPVDVDALRADRATTARLAKLAVESNRQVGGDRVGSRKRRTVAARR